MKKILVIVVYLWSSSLLNGQNLVPNPSFEIHDTCPYATNQVQFATGWNNYGNTPDYFNSCATSISEVSVPSNFVGYHQAYNGNAYCGLHCFTTTDTAYREFIGATLNSPLQIGERYYVSAEFSLSNLIAYSIAINKLCVKFSTISYSQNSVPSFDNFAQIVSDSIVTDTGSWYQLKGSFIADSAYTNIIIGNFFKEYLVDTIQVNDFAEASYYFVDMVCVSIDSNTCYTSMRNGIPTFKNDYNTLKFNYNENEIILTNLTQTIINTKINITDLLGQNIYSNHVSFNGQDKIPIGFLTSSIYFLTIQTNNNIQTIKFIKK